MSDSGVNDQPVSNEPEGRLPKSSPGARLAGLREERGWTVEQVASQLNLAPRQVLAIERDDYPALPGMAVARGFVRAYAKLLKVDATPFLADLGGETVLVHDSLAPQKSLSMPFADSRLPSMAERSGVSSKWVVVALVVVLLAVGIWAMRYGSEQATIPADGTSVVKDGQASPPRVHDEQPASEGKPEAPASSAESDSASPLMAETPASTGAQAHTDPQPVPVIPAGSSAASNDVLKVAAREESWIEIRRSSDNEVLFSRIVKPGETETIPVTEPVSVVVGNATGVDASLRGTPLELRASSKNNVARLTLK